LQQIVDDVPGGFVTSPDSAELPSIRADSVAALEEARENLHEAVEQVLAANRELSRESVGAAKVIREPLKIAG